MHAAGFRAGDLVHNSFSYHLTPGAWMMESGAHALGCTTFPGGVGNTELQLQAMADLRPTAMPARPASCASWSRRPPKPARPAQPEEGAGQRRGLSRPACATGWRARRQAYQAYATAEPA
jgi:phenylacetate-CoA ligase